MGRLMMRNPFLVSHSVLPTEGRELTLCTGVEKKSTKLANKFECRDLPSPRFDMGSSLLGRQRPL